MAKLPRLLRREPALSESEAQLSMERMLARLEGVRTGRGAIEPEPDEAVRVPVPIEVVGVEDDEAFYEDEPVAGEASTADEVDETDARDDAPRLPARLVSVMAEPGEFGPVELPSQLARRLGYRVMVEPGEFGPVEPLLLPDPATARFAEPGRPDAVVVDSDGWDLGVVTGSEDQGPLSSASSPEPQATAEDAADHGIATEPPVPVKAARAPRRSAKAATARAADATPAKAPRAPRKTARATAAAASAADAKPARAPRKAAKVGAATLTVVDATAAKAPGAPRRTAKAGTATTPAANATGAVSATATGKAAPAHPARRPAAAAGARKSRRRVPPASCPYCAHLLVPPPETSRRCTECKQRVVVRRVEGRAVYLTEAAVLVFEAQRKRAVNSGRLERERARWLKLAATVGAPGPRIERLGRASLSDETVNAARALYLGAADRAFRAARRDRRWDEASTVRRDLAAALYRAAGSPTPPPDDVLALHREAAVAGLRGVAELANDASLVGTACCDVCRVDEGLVFRISTEIKVGRLPHAGCKRGLCRCRWALAQKDKSLVARYLRRRPRAEVAAK